MPFGAPTPCCVLDSSRLHIGYRRCPLSLDARLDPQQPLLWSQLPSRLVAGPPLHGGAWFVLDYRAALDLTCPFARGHRLPMLWSLISQTRSPGCTTREAARARWDRVSHECAGSSRCGLPALKLVGPGGARASGEDPYGGGVDGSACAHTDCRRDPAAADIPRATTSRSGWNGFFSTRPRSARRPG